MNGRRTLESALAALVVGWLLAGLLTHPAAFGALALLALVPLTLVVLPALAVYALGDRSVTVRRLAPVRRAQESTPPRPRRGYPSDD
jgi:hypothetical protein